MWRSRPGGLWARVNRSDEEQIHGVPALVDHNYLPYPSTTFPSTSWPSSKKTKKKSSKKVKEGNVIVGPHSPQRETEDSDYSTKALPTTPPWSERNWFGIWWLEILGIVCSIGCTAAIVGVLLTIDGKPLHTWRLVGIADSLTPNALVSILSTLSKVTLLYSVAQGLGQLKWYYFQQRPRRLNDMQIFDEATRGPTGALTLLFKLHFHSDAALLGALIMILTLGVDVVIQQVLTYPAQSMVAGNLTASVSSSQSYIADITEYSEYAPGPDYNEMTSSFKRGIYGFDPEDTLDVFCASGNCTWAPFDTLGICSSCEDISDHTTIECGAAYTKTKDYGGFMGSVGRALDNTALAQTCNYTTPNGHKSSVAWARINGTVAPSWAGSSNGSVDFASFVDAPDQNMISASGEIINYTSIAIDSNMTAWQVPNFTMIKPQAQFCQWKWCAQRYAFLRFEHGTITGLNYTAQPLKWDCRPRPDYGTKCVGVHQDAEFPTDFTALALPNRTSTAWAQNLVIPENVYVINLDGFVQMGIYLNDKLGRMLANGSNNANSNLDDLRAFIVANNGSIATTVGNMAASFNRMLRDRPEAKVENGLAWTGITLVSVNWPLLVYPAVLPLLGAIFLVATMVHSRNTLPWKSSLLAVLYHGLEEHDDVHGRIGNYNETMQKAGKRTFVQLGSVRGNKRLLHAATI